MAKLRIKLTEAEAMAKRLGFTLPFGGKRLPAVIVEKYAETLSGIPSPATLARRYAADLPGPRFWVFQELCKGKLISTGLVVPSAELARAARPDLIGRMVLKPLPPRPYRRKFPPLAPEKWAGLIRAMKGGPLPTLPVSVPAPLRALWGPCGLSYSDKVSPQDKAFAKVAAAELRHWGKPLPTPSQKKPRPDPRPRLADLYERTSNYTFASFAAHRESITGKPTDPALVDRMEAKRSHAVPRIVAEYMVGLREDDPFSKYWIYR